MNNKEMESIIEKHHNRRCLLGDRCNDDQCPVKIQVEDLVKEVVDTCILKIRGVILPGGYCWGCALDRLITLCDVKS